jgi:hypothetical protein
MGIALLFLEGNISYCELDLKPWRAEGKRGILSYIGKHLRTADAIEHVESCCN